MVDSSGKGSFTAVIKWEHRRCPLAKDDVNVDGKGVKVLRQSGWEKVRRGLYRNRYEIQLKGRKGSIRIWRRCDKKGVSEGTITIRR